MPIAQIKFAEQEQQIIVDPFHEATTDRKIIEKLLKLDAMNFRYGLIFNYKIIIFLDTKC